MYIYIYFRYYFDSAIGCGACCALAGACRSMRRTWTGLGLAGLAAFSCAGLLLLATKSPRPGTPLHDVTAGALCGVSLLGAVLALLALIAPRCSVGRHRRVHSWIPRFSP
jgi:peptidoglycan/LPS O-acetylase OafA/YrhL